MLSSTQFRLDSPLVLMSFRAFGTVGVGESWIQNHTHCLAVSFP